MADEGDFLNLIQSIRATANSLSDSHSIALGEIHQKVKELRSRHRDALAAVREEEKQKYDTLRSTILEQRKEIVRLTNRNEKQSSVAERTTENLAKLRIDAKAAREQLKSEIAAVRKEEKQRRDTLKSATLKQNKEIRRLTNRLEKQSLAAERTAQDLSRLRIDAKAAQGQLKSEIATQRATINVLQPHRIYYLKNRPHDFDKDLFKELTSKKNFNKVELEAINADAVFVSLSKSGRTWVRFFLQHYVELARNIPFDVRPNAITGLERHHRFWLTEDFFDYFLHEERPPSIVYRKDIARRAMVLMMRDPRDSVVSMYHWLNTHRRTFGSEGIQMRKFVHSPIYGIERASDFVVQLYRLYEEHSGPKHILTYEQCWADPRRRLGELLHFLDGEYDHKAYDEALHLSSFDQMRQQEIALSKANDPSKFSRMGIANWDGNENALKVRRGGTDTYKDEAPWLDDEIAEMPKTQELISIIDSYRPA